MDSFNKFPSGKKRREIISENKEFIDMFKAAGKNAICRYSWRNSPLEGEYVQNIGQSFAKSFYNTFDDEKGIKHFIETTLKTKKGEAIGVEFGGIGENLFKGFTPGFFTQSVGITLVDHRNDDEKLEKLTEEDLKMNHQILEGDIFDPSTYESLKRLLENKKIDLIIERMGGGLDYVPEEPYYVSKILEKWYELLSEGGVMFIQTPVKFNFLLKTWAMKIREEFEDKIKIEYKTGSTDGNTTCSAFCLRKMAGAPNKLPLLDPKIVKEIPEF